MNAVEAWIISNKRLITIGCLMAIFLLSITLYFCNDKSSAPERDTGCPGLCQDIRIGQMGNPMWTPEGSRDASWTDDATGSNPVWVISWTAPKVGTGPGYSVTYSGQVLDKTQKSIYTFSNLSATNFDLPDTTTPGDYNVSVVATNQFGAGPAYTQKVTLTNHYPTISSATLNPNKGSYLAIIGGNFPDLDVKDTKNYTFTYKVTNKNGEEIHVTNFQYTFVSNFEMAAKFNAPAPNPGDALILVFNICNYNMCVSGAATYSVSGSKPGQSSNIVTNLRV
jgi:hypothetical protein